MQRETNITIALVVAMTKNRVIGHGNTLPWHISDDLKWFKKNTLGKPIIMGRKTFDSIGRPLPGRDNIVITRNTAFEHIDVTVAHDLEDAIAIGEAFAIARGCREICIIGGAEIYKQALPFARKIYLTEVAAEIEGDAWFPEIEADKWDAESVGEITKNDKNEYGAVIKLLSKSSN